MSRDDLDRWLADDDAIVPSSGFTASVMEAVSRDLSAPKPLPFPWARALPGLLATALSLLAGIWAALSNSTGLNTITLDQLPLQPVIALINDAQTIDALAWLALAIVTAAVPAWLSLKVTRAR